MASNLAFEAVALPYTVDGPAVVPELGRRPEEPLPPMNPFGRGDRQAIGRIITDKMSPDRAHFQPSHPIQRASEALNG